MPSLAGGRVKADQQDAALLQEARFFIRPVDKFLTSLQEAYMSLTNKTLSFLRMATTLFDAEYIVKADDDVYLRLDRLPLAIKQWRTRGAGRLTAWPTAPLFGMALLPGDLKCEHVPAPCSGLCMARQPLEQPACAIECICLEVSKSIRP